MSLEENISLVEGGGSGGDPPLMDGGQGGTHLSHPRTAWEGMSLDSESGRGSGYPVGDNVVSMEEISGGTDYWSRNGGGAPASTGAWSEGAPQSTGAWSHDTLQQEIVDLKEQLAEERLQRKSEVGKLKNQLEAIQASETADSSREGALKSELERVKEELSLANEKISEYEQELMFNGMWTESPSSSVHESMGVEGKGSAELRAQLDEVKEALRLKEEEVSKARDSLHSTQEQLRQSRQQVTHLSEKVNNPDSLNSELERVKRFLSICEGELKESREMAAVGKRELEEVSKRLAQRVGEVEETRERLVHRERELEETRASLGRKERELEGVQETLQNTLEQLELARRDGGESEKKPTPTKTKLEEQRRAKLNKAMEEIEKYRMQATSYQKKCQDLATLKEKIAAEKGALESSLQVKESELSKSMERTAELELALQTKESELGQLREGNEGFERDLKRAHSQYQKEILDLQSSRDEDKKEFEYEKRELSVRISQLEVDKQTHSSRIGQLEQSIAGYCQDIEAQKEKEEELKQHLEVTRREKNHTVLQLEQESEKAVKAERRIKEVEKDRNDLQAQIFALNEEKDRLATEKLDVEEVCGEFKDEAEKTMADYNKLADDYKQACKDRDEFGKQRRNAMSTLAKRNSEIDEKEKKIKDLENDLAAMREQLSVYEDGFKTERTSREKAVKQIKDLNLKVQTLEKDKKELRDQINRQSASQFHHEFSEDYHSPSPITSPRGIVSPRGGGGQYAASPGANGANFPGPGSGQRPNSSGQRH